MKLDNDLLKQMISETLEQISEEDITEAEQELEESSCASEEEKMEEQEVQQETVIETFQLKKGRLRQIISEELISAKKQGII